MILTFYVLNTEAATCFEVRTRLHSVFTGVHASANTTLPTVPDSEIMCTK